MSATIINLEDINVEATGLRVRKYVDRITEFKYHRVKQEEVLLDPVDKMRAYNCVIRFGINSTRLQCVLYLSEGDLPTNIDVLSYYWEKRYKSEDVGLLKKIDMLFSD